MGPRTGLDIIRANTVECMKSFYNIFAVSFEVCQKFEVSE
jgi:hypothetical protein